MNSNLLTKKEIFKVLNELNLKSNDNILIHSSLKSIGRIEGDAEGLIDALKEYFKDGMILFPTHSWSFMKNDGDILNLNEANSCVGALTNIALKKGFKRSHHPTHSVCGYGKNIDDYLKYDNESKTPVSPNGCFGQLKNYNFKILFLGAKISKNTFIHSIEEEYDVLDRFTSHIYHFYSFDGFNKYEYYMPKHYTSYNPHISDNYIKIYDGLKEKSILKEFLFGNAKSCMIDAKKCYEYVSNLLKGNKHYFDKL